MYHDKHDDPNTRLLTPDDLGSTLEVPVEFLGHTPKRDADAANLRTVAAYAAVLALVLLVLVSPALVIGTWKALL